MPGIKFHSGPAGQLPVPRKESFLLAGGSGGGLNYYNGDIVVLTQKSTLTANGVSVARPLIAADKTAHYQEGTPVAGILGVINTDAVSNGLGQCTGVPATAGVANGAGIIFSLPGESYSFNPDAATGRNRMSVLLASSDNYFVAYLNNTVTATHALDGTLAGLTLTVVNGVTTYTIDTAAAAADQCVVIDRVDESDPLYNQPGGAVVFRFRAGFVQLDQGVVYSSN